ncbi:hypothetical protein BH10BAC5_BH10BAC5_16850 [soil metagenome]
MKILDIEIADELPVFQKDELIKDKLLKGLTGVEVVFQKK